MTIQDATAILQLIEAQAGYDDEVAHGLEDELYLDFIRHVANTPGPHQELAALVLTAKDIEFERWRA